MNNSFFDLLSCRHIKLRIHLQTVRKQFVANHLQSVFETTQRMFTAHWVWCSSEFLFSFMFARRFLYLANNFHTTANSLQLVRHFKINFPNMFANTMFASVYAVLSEHRGGIWCTFCKLWDPGLLWEYPQWFMMPNSSLGKGISAYSKGFKGFVQNEVDQFMDNHKHCLSLWKVF